MWISTRAQYGLRALIEIGQQQRQLSTGQAVSLREISKRQNISLHYLEQIVADLRRAGFVKSVRGAKGGYHLARDAKSISAYEVVLTLEGSLAPVACAEDDHQCDHENICGTQQLWLKVDQAVRDVLSSNSLQSLVDQAQQEQLIQLETDSNGT